MVDEAMCQAGLIYVNQSDAVLAGDVACGNNYEFLPVNSRAESDVFDFPSRNPAAHGCPVQHARQSHIVYIASLSTDFLAALQSRDGCSDDATISLGNHVIVDTPVQSAFPETCRR